ELEQLALAERDVAGLQRHDALIVLERQNFLFLLLQQLVDLRDVLVGRLLDLVVPSPLLVLGDLLVLGERLELLVRLAAEVPDRHRSEERRVGKECRSRWWAYH